eukprot:TRINITY_DN877_c0_g1_i1.p1 TRINITY_DN877_c0_g1~~TRINITY_DN877_c0_g1_i1.p1  ORF type:complete len:696 (+),score=108.04 TRINITY_DN877_c0_g1_i1:161-2089(+)
MAFSSKSTFRFDFFLILLLACCAIFKVSGKAVENRTQTKEIIEVKDVYEIAKESLEYDDYVELRRRSKQVEKELVPIVKALPESSSGYIHPDSFRESLHRLFQKLEGWSVRDLRSPSKKPDQEAALQEVSQLLPKLNMPYEVPSLTSGETSMSVQDATQTMAVIATLLEESVMQEDVDQFLDAYDVILGLAEEPKHSISAADAEDVLLVTMKNLLLVGSDRCKYDGQSHKCPVGLDIERFYPAWKQLKSFLQGRWQLRGKHLRSNSKWKHPRSKKNKGHGRHARQALKKHKKHHNKHHKKRGVSFEDLLGMALQLKDDFKDFSNQVCSDMKLLLTELEGQCPGRVPLALYYDSLPQFNESIDYLWSLGALHEQQAGHLSVLVPNILSGGSNCVKVGQHYVHCCADPCEDMISDLSEKLGTASPTLDVLMNDLTVQSLTDLLQGDYSKLEDLVLDNNGTLPLRHPRFAHVLHKVYPRVCRRPAEDSEPDLLRDEYFKRAPPCEKQDKECHQTLRGLTVSEAEKDLIMPMEEGKEKCLPDDADSTLPEASVESKVPAKSSRNEVEDPSIFVSRLLSRNGEDTADQYTKKIDPMPILAFLTCFSLFVAAGFMAFKLAKRARRTSAMTTDCSLNVGGESTPPLIVV